MINIGEIVDARIQLHRFFDAIYYDIDIMTD